jgi:hypothetical protein
MIENAILSIKKDPHQDGTNTKEYGPYTAQGSFQLIGFSKTVLYRFVFRLFSPSIISNIDLELVIHRVSKKRAWEIPRP